MTPTKKIKEFEKELVRLVNASFMWGVMSDDPIEQRRRFCWLAKESNDKLLALYQEALEDIKCYRDGREIP